MPGFRPIDLLVLAVIALLFFGPKRLPEMGSAIGKTIKEFQKSMHEVTTPNQTTAQTTLPTAPAQPAPQVAASVTEVPPGTVPTTNSAVQADHSND